MGKGGGSGSSGGRPWQWSDEQGQYNLCCSQEPDTMYNVKYKSKQCY